MSMRRAMLALIVSGGVLLPLRSGLAQAAASAAAGQVITQDGVRPGTPSRPTDPALEARTSAVAAGLRCPVCQGLSIQDSPSELAQQMRSLVRDQLAAGRTPDEVRAYFISKYGEWILLEPKATGFNVLVYVLPVLLVVGGLVFILMLVRKWTVPGDPLDGGAAPETSGTT